MVCVSKCKKLEIKMAKSASDRMQEQFACFAGLNNKFLKTIRIHVHAFSKGSALHQIKEYSLASSYSIRAQQFSYHVSSKAVTLAG